VTPSIATFRVVIDACALYPLNLRDTLLRSAERGYFQLYWSGEILDEIHRNLVKNSFMTADQAARSRKMMIAAFPEAMVVGYEELVAAMHNHEKDRHVAAAALKARTGDRDEQPAGLRQIACGHRSVRVTNSPMARRTRRLLP